METTICVDAREMIGKLEGDYFRVGSGGSSVVKSKDWGFALPWWGINVRFPVM